VGIDGGEPCSGSLESVSARTICYVTPDDEHEGRGPRSAAPAASASRVLADSIAYHRLRRIRRQPPETR
jgi:hypothetical protein